MRMIGSLRKSHWTRNFSGELLLQIFSLSSLAAGVTGGWREIHCIIAYESWGQAHHINANDQQSHARGFDVRDLEKWRAARHVCNNRLCCSART